MYAFSSPLKKINKRATSLLVLSSLVSSTFLSSAYAADKSDKGKFYADFRLRFEQVEQNNALENGTGLTLRSRIGYITPTYSGFSAQVELENTRVLNGDFSVPATGFNPGEFSVIADPENETEIDQAFLKYKSGGFYGKLGRQVIVRDNQRFVGHVGFRQDRQTFDALSLGYKLAGGLDLKFAYIEERNIIFANADVDSEDILLDASYKFGSGKIGAFAYLLELDNDTENGIDTYGVSYRGATKVGSNKIKYTAVLATQDTDTPTASFSTEYINLEGHLKFAAPFWVKVGYELLGSDNGAEAFATPLATLHKFNGFADVFINTPDAGLEDFYIGIGGKVSSFKWFATFHDFSSDESLGGSSDLGSEIDFGVSRKINKNWTVGAKAALYDAGDSAFNLVDTDRYFVWANLKI